MDGNENNKSMEALPDEALDKVTGGDGLTYLPFKIPCHRCPRCDETVMYYTIKDESGGYGMNLCPDCAAELRKDHTVYEGFHLF